MVRSSVALAAFALILASALVAPDAVRAQETPDGDGEPDYTVERGDFLWNLARQYYDDPFQWRRIYEANLDRVEDPNLIYPGQELIIPGVGTVVVEAVDVSTPDGEPEPGLDASGARVYPGPDESTVFSNPPRTDIPAPTDRTAFYRSLSGRAVDESGGVLATEGVEYFEVSPDDFYSAAWLVDEGREETAIYPGEVVGWAGARAETREDATIHPFDQIELTWGGSAPPATGQVVQLVRVGRLTEGFGYVVQPTGLARVIEARDSTLVAVVTDAYRRPRSGDYALSAPRFTLQPGEYAVDVTDSEDARVTRLLGFARDNRIQQLGDIVFLPLGTDDGVSVGDVFAVEGGEGRGGAMDLAYSVQVVRVFEDRASARIAHIQVPVFGSRAPIRRIRRMP